jgi:hypothetical protein
MDESKWFSLHFLSNIVLAIKKVLKDSEIDQATAQVKASVDEYASSISNAAIAMQAKRATDEENENVLEWICPSNGKYLPPKPLDGVKDTCQAFLNSNEYLSWAGSGPSTLICKGHRTFRH